MRSISTRPINVQAHYGKAGKSSPVQSERYFLTCSRYIELNPVAANMVSKPEQYKWSSYMCNAWGSEGIVEQHIEYLKLGEDP